MFICSFFIRLRFVTTQVVEGDFSVSAITAYTTPSRCKTKRRRTVKNDLLMEGTITPHVLNGFHCHEVSETACRLGQHSVAPQSGAPEPG